MEQFEKLLKKRNNVVHSFKSINKAHTLTDAWRLHYNFFAGNDTTGYIPPAQKMGKMPFKKWKDVISQSSIKNNLSRDIIIIFKIYYGAINQDCNSHDTVILLDNV